MQVAGRAEEERRERLAVTDPAALGLDGGRGQVRSSRITCDQVADAGPVVRQQALAVGDARDDQGRVGGVARRHEVLAVALVPAEGRDAVVVAVEDARLTGRRHRGQERLPARQLVGPVPDPACHRVDRPGADPAGKDRMCQPVDLDDHQAGLVRVPLRSLHHQALDEHAVVGAAAVDTQDGGQDSVDDRVDERADQRDQEPGDMDAGCPLRDHQERNHLEDQDQDPRQHERDRRSQDQKHRADGRVEQGHQDHRERGVGRAFDRHPWVQDPDRPEERHRRHEQGDDQPLDKRDRTALPVPEHADLRRVELDETTHGSP